MICQKVKVKTESTILGCIHFRRVSIDCSLSYIVYVTLCIWSVCIVFFSITFPMQLQVCCLSSVSERDGSEGKIVQ